MTPSGRVGYFDGSQHQWIADGIWPFLQIDIDSSNTHRIHGCYDYRIATVIFWYPRSTDVDGLCTGMLVINWPYPLAGIQNFAYFTGVSSFPVTNSTTMPTVLGLPVHPIAYSSASGIRFSHLLSKD